MSDTRFEKLITWMKRIIVILIFLWTTAGTIIFIVTKVIEVSRSRSYRNQIKIAKTTEPKDQGIATLKFMRKLDDTYLFGMYNDRINTKEIGNLNREYRGVGHISEKRMSSYEMGERFVNVLFINLTDKQKMFSNDVLILTANLFRSNEYLPTFTVIEKDVNKDGILSDSDGISLFSYDLKKKRLIPLAFGIKDTSDLNNDHFLVSAYSNSNILWYDIDILSGSKKRIATSPR